MSNCFFRGGQTILLLLLSVDWIFAQESKSGRVICESQPKMLQTAKTTKNPDEYLALAYFQKVGDWVKAEQAATRILRDDPDNVCALAVVLYAKRSSTTFDYKDWAIDSARGLQLLETWRKPQDMSEADYKKQHDAMAVVFYGGAGFGALSAKNFSVARERYLKSLLIDPNNLEDNYQLGVAELEMTPVNPQGFWYMAKAIDLARHEGNANAISAMNIYAKAKYRKYHKGEDGWDQIVANAATETAPPPGFTVKAH